MSSPSVLDLEHRSRFGAWTAAFVTVYMVLLTVGEVGGFAVLFAGWLSAL